MKNEIKCCETGSRQVAEELIEAWDAKFFKTLGEPVRMDILQYLLLNGRSDIGSISEDLPQDRSVISRHLQMMHENGLLFCEKENRFRYYSINGNRFLLKLETVVKQLKNCFSVCCPECLVAPHFSTDQQTQSEPST